MTKEYLSELKQDVRVANLVTTRTKDEALNHNTEVAISFHPEVPVDKQIEIVKDLANKALAGSVWVYGPKQVSKDTWTVTYGFCSGD